MPHREAAIGVIELKLWTLSRNGAKRVIRTACAIGNRLLLRLLSRPYTHGDGLTVVFAPHPDDETLGCGGLIARKRYEGLPVHVVFVTDGGGSHLNHPHLTVPDVIALRKREAAAALRELGVESCAVHFLDEPDGTLDRITPERAQALRGRIAALVGELKPEEVLLPCRHDASSEHDAAFDLIIPALRDTGLHPTVWQYPIWSWWNPLLMFRHILTSATRARLPNADFTLSKRTAIACYASQIGPTPPWKEAVIPADLVATLRADTEYFFSQKLP